MNYNPWAAARGTSARSLRSKREGLYLLESYSEVELVDKTAMKAGQMAACHVFALRSLRIRILIVVPLLKKRKEKKTTADSL